MVFNATKEVKSWPVQSMCKLTPEPNTLGARGVPVADGCPRLHQSFSYVILSADSEFRRFTVGRLLVFLLLTI